MATPAASASPRRVAAGNPAPLVLAGGLATTALALAGVWALSRYAETNVMGWYANYVLPVGAILVGLVASSGFGIGSWLGGARITGGLLAAVAVALLAGYWAAQLLEFHLLFPEGASFEDGTPAGFLDWYDAVTRSFAWEDHGKAGAPLGAFGYALRAGEMLGFAGGGLVAPALLRKAPYCSACRVYMRSPLVALLPAGIAPKRVSKRNVDELAARETQAREAYERALVGLERLLAAGRAGDPAAFAAAAAEEGPLASRSAAEKLSARVHLQAVHCRRCGAGELRAQLVTGQGSQIRFAPLASQPLEQGVAPRLASRR
ncbi:MAG TPA: hypothetical protein VLS93_11085 [Anaeromyxobacteraceae bacterium]|nr:hypothetical protein [Anaeromyxobacteraceae bacterium]